MKFYKYWDRAEAPVETRHGTWNIRCYGGSNTSLEDAKANACEIANRAAKALASGREGSRYLYAERALREEIVEELGSADEPSAIVTRNSYGSLVLNTANSLFADIDYPQPRPQGFWQVVRAIFGGGSSRDLPKVDGEIITRLHDYTEQHPEVGLRLYRTAAGYRCLFTHRVFEPDSTDAQQILEDIGSDPLYAKLCRAQGCFRARLTPKFWRCGVERPPRGFPWRTQDEERRFREWLVEYERQADTFSTCAPVGSFGNEDVHPAVFPILELHDIRTCVDGPLA